MGATPATEVVYGPTPGKANMEFSMPADLLHSIWMGEESSSQAFFSGQIKTKGNFMKAMQLVDLFRECGARLSVGRSGASPAVTALGPHRFSSQNQRIRNSGCALTPHSAPYIIGSPRGEWNAPDFVQ